MDTSSHPKRRQYTDRYRRQVVAETRRGTESVSEVARRHALNTNLLFKWRQRYPELSTSAGASAPSLIPIHLTSMPVDADEAPTDQSADGPPGQIAITLSGGHQLSLTGCVDPALVRVVLQSLR